MNKEYFKKFVKIAPEKEVNNNVWCYTRVSSKRQFDTNSSIENQINHAKRLADKKGFTITNEFGNTYESAKDDFTRKEFTKLIEHLQKSKQKPFGIMIYKMSRFSRTGSVAIGLVNEIVHKYGVHLIEVSTETDTTTIEGEQRIIESLMHARKENIERLSITIPGLKNFVNKGLWLGKAPRGYDHYGPRVKNTKFIQGEQELKINKEGELFREAWKWKLQNIPDFKIIKKLELRGLKISKQSLSAMWRNPFYCGISTNSFLEGNIIEGKWDKIVSYNDFKIINDQFDQKPKNEYDQYTSQEFRPLQNHLYCGSCGSKMTGYKAKKRYEYYKCLNSKCSCKDLNANSTKKSVNEGIHNTFIELLNTFKLNETLLEVFKEQIKLTLNHLNNDYFNDVNRLNNELKNLEDKKEKLDRKFAFEDLDKELYNRFKNEINEKILRIEEKLEEFEIKISNLNKKVEDVFKLTQNINEIWASGDYETKTLLQKLVFPTGIVIDPVSRQYRTNNMNSIFHLINSFTTPKDTKNKKRISKKTDPFVVVAGTGLEPVTFGL